LKAVRWRAKARRDASEAAQWYAEQGGLEVELAFIAALQAAESLIAEFPASGSPRHADVVQGLPAPLRFHPIRRFERYLIYYVELPEYAEVIRLWNAARGLEALMDPME
jgi:toxin ParE1/3/4